MMDCKRKNFKLLGAFYVAVIVCGLFWIQGCLSRNIIAAAETDSQTESKTDSKEEVPEIKPEGSDGYIDDSFGARLAKMEIPEQFRLKEIIVGNPEALKTLTVYFSYTCPHCREFHQNEFPRFKREYVDKGLVKVIFRNYLDDQGAYEAALVVRCVCNDDPEKYLQLSEIIIGKQKEWLSSDDPAKFLIKLFESAGIAEDKIQEYLKRTDIGAGLMLEQKKAMWELNLYSMPAFINDKGEKHIGSITYEELLKLCGCDA